MKYKEKDRVRIKSLDWYNENKDEYGYVRCTDFRFTPEHSKYCGCEFTISHITEFRIPTYVMESNGHEWVDEMIEGLVEEEIKPKFKVGDIIISDVFSTKDDKGWKVIKVERTGYRLVSVNNPDLICDMDFKNEQYYKFVEEETKPNVIEEAKAYWDSIKDAWICPEGYIFKDQDGNVINATKIVLEKKKKEYPKTYVECCKVMGIDVRDLDILDNMLDTTEIIYRKNLDRLLNSFRKLLICRDTYWKIAGEELGLRKPWKPDWGNVNQNKHCIRVDVGDIILNEGYRCQHILAFPSKEMRDAFYENFKNEIEFCKELL